MTQSFHPSTEKFEMITSETNQKSLLFSLFTDQLTSYTFCKTQVIFTFSVFKLYSGLKGLASLTVRVTSVSVSIQMIKNKTAGHFYFIFL